MATKKPLTESEWEKLFRLRCRSKAGQTMSPEEMEFCGRAYRENPKRYGEMERAVFEATKPFGA